MVLWCVALIRNDASNLVEKFDSDGRLVGRTWLHPLDGLPHRDNAPAVQTFDPRTGTLTSEIWINRNRHGRHRGVDKPSEVSINPQTGTVFVELYERDGRLHRVGDRPAQILRDPDTGKTTYFEFRHEGLLHRPDGLPAIQEFCSSEGRLIAEEYYEYGDLHRLDGPAIVTYDAEGRVDFSSVQYFIRGTAVSRHDPQPS